MKKLIIIAIILWAIFFAWIGFGAEVVPAYDLLNSELGQPAGTSLVKTPKDPLIGALKRALYKYPDQTVSLSQSATSGRCAETDIVQAVTEMGLYVAPAKAVAIVDAIYNQCPIAKKGIERAMSAKMVINDKKVIVADEEPEAPPITPPINPFLFPSPPTVFEPVTPVQDTIHRK